MGKDNFLPNKLLLVFLFVLNAFCAYGQEVLRGNVVNEKGIPLEYVSVALLYPSDSVVVTGVVTDASGSFAIPASVGQWLIRASLIGYKTEFLHCETVRPTLGTITLRETALELESITITEDRPGVKIIPEGLSFSPTKTELKLPDLTGYLEQLPFVEISGKGFSVIGRGAAVVYVNNHRLEDIGELKEYKPEDVLAVDLIPNPGPAYGADVKAVIRIKTKRKKTGLGAEWTSNVTHSEKTEFWNQAKVAYNTSELTFQSTLTYDHDPTAARISIEQLMGKDRSEKVVYDSREDQVYKGLDFRNSVVYTPTDRHSMGVSLTYAHSSWETGVFNNLYYSGSGGSTDFSQSSATVSPGTHWMGNLFYNYTDGKWNLLLNADFYRRSGSRSMTSVSSDRGEAEDLSTKSMDSSLLGYFQAIGKYNVTDRFSLQAGADYAYTSVSQSYDTDNQNIGLTSFDIGTRQNRVAVYTSLDYTLVPLLFSVGLRYEGLNIEREDKIKEYRSRLFSISKLYPSASVSFSEGSFQAQASYSMKTRYPAYNQLRAGMSYSSPYLYEGGNPDLRPETSHEVSLLARYGGTTLMAGLSNIHDEIIQLPELYNSRIMLYSPKNLGTNKYFSLSVSQRFKWAKVVQTTLSASYLGQWLNVPGFTNERGDAFSLKVNNTITLGDHLTCYFNGGYSSPSEVSLYKVPETWNLDAAVNVSLLSDRLNIYLECNDILSTRHGKRDYFGEEITMLYNRNYQTRTWSLTLSYTLPSLFRGKSYKGNTTNDEIQRL